MTEKLIKIMCPMMAILVFIFGDPTSTGVHAVTHVWDITSDYSDKYNPNGSWTYGWQPYLGGPLTLLLPYWYPPTPQWVWGRTRSGYCNDSNNIWLNISSVPRHGVPPGWVSLHPGPGWEPTVARWTSPVSGHVLLTGQFGAGDWGVMDAYIQKNGQTLWDRQDFTTDQAFSLAVDVEVGDRLDWIVTGGWCCGNTPLAAKIVYDGPPVNEAPMADAGGPYRARKAIPFLIPGSDAMDPDGDVLRYRWTCDPPACTFSDSAVLRPWVTCSQSGSYALTLTVDDGSNSPVSSVANLEVAGDPPVWDLAADFSGAYNPNGEWSYGWQANLSSAFVPMERFWKIPDAMWLWGRYPTECLGQVHMWKNRYSDNRYGVPPQKVSVHPGPDGEAGVVRWTSPISRRMIVEGLFGAGDRAALDAYIRWNGVTIWERQDFTTDQTFALELNLTAGDRLDWLVTGGYWSGNTPVDVRLTPVGLPPNEPPTVSAGGPYEVGEGGSVPLAALGSDPEGGPLDYAWDLDHDGVFETPGQSITFWASDLDGPSAAVVAVRATDGGGLAATDEAQVLIVNLPPTLGPITGAPVGAVRAGTLVDSVQAVFIDPGVLDTHTAIWDWGDGTTSVGTVSEVGGSGSAQGSHAYTTPGLHSLGLTVTDDDGASAHASYQFVVVYDPDAGSVTGGGWINSPAGAHVAQPALTGKASFGFVAKYHKGAGLPSGNLEFQFRPGDLNFKATRFDWLVVTGATAKLRGVGTINGAGSYPFMLTAVDGKRAGGSGVDGFRMQIWNDRGVVYDNKMGADAIANDTTEVGGGSIVIHKP